MKFEYSNTGTSGWTVEMTSRGIFMSGIGNYNGANAGDTSALTITEWISQTFQPKPVVLYEATSGSGLIGENTHSLNLTNWQLENMDFSPYKYVIAYIKQADLPISGTNNAYITPSLMCCIPLDVSSKSSQYDAYVGSTGGYNMNDPDVQFGVICAIDSTKTKFKVVSEHSVAGTILGDRNTQGRYCYKIEGCF